MKSHGDLCLLAGICWINRFLTLKFIHMLIPQVVISYPCAVDFPWILLVVIFIVDHRTEKLAYRRSTDPNRIVMCPVTSDEIENSVQHKCFCKLS